MLRLATSNWFDFCQSLSTCMKGHIPLVWSLSQIHRTFDDMISLRQHLKASVDYVCFSRPLENLTAAPRVVCYFVRRIHISKIAQVSNMFQGLKRNVIRYLKHESYISAKRKRWSYVIIKIYHLHLVDPKHQHNNQLQDMSICKFKEMENLTRPPKTLVFLKMFSVGLVKFSFSEIIGCLRLQDIPKRHRNGIETLKPLTCLVGVFNPF